MKFKRAEDRSPDLYHRMESDDGKIDWDEIPFIQIKPFYNDPNFMEVFPKLIAKYNNGIGDKEKVLKQMINEERFTYIDDSSLLMYQDQSWNDIASMGKAQ